MFDNRYDGVLEKWKLRLICRRARRMGFRQHGLALGGGPLGEGLGRRAVNLTGPGIDRATDGVLGLEAITPFEHQGMHGTADEVRRPVLVGNQAELLLVVERWAFPEIPQGVARQILPGLRQILFKRLAEDKTDVGADEIGGWHDAQGWVPGLAGGGLHPIGSCCCGPLSIYILSRRTKCPREFQNIRSAPSRRRRMRWPAPVTAPHTRCLGYVCQSGPNCPKITDRRTPPARNRGEPLAVPCGHGAGEFPSGEPPRRCCPPSPADTHRARRQAWRRWTGRKPRNHRGGRFRHVERRRCGETESSLEMKSASDWRPSPFGQGQWMKGRGTPAARFALGLARRGREAPQRAPQARIRALVG